MHYHRGSVYTRHDSAELLPDYANLEPETSVATYSDPDEVMQLAGIMTQWCGPDPYRWSDYIITGHAFREGAIQIRPVKRIVDEWSIGVVYFPWLCEGRCPSAE